MFVSETVEKDAHMSNLPSTPKYEVFLICYISFILYFNRDKSFIGNEQFINQIIEFD